MRIGYVSCRGRGATAPCIAGAAALLARRGLLLAGTVAEGEEGGLGPCDAGLRVLPDGPLLAIRQELGAGAQGCRLDGGALEAVVAAVRSRLAGADLLVVNKFGKIEAMGRGFVPLIAEALEAGIPVLVGVSAMDLDDFLAFSAGTAEPVGATPEAAARWGLVAAGMVEA